MQNNEEIKVLSNIINTIKKRCWFLWFRYMFQV